LTVRSSAIVDDAVVVEKIVEAISSRGNLFDIGAHELRGACAQIPHGLQHEFIAVFVEQIVESTRAKVKRIDLTVDVTIDAVRKP
jgi:hypothetical protein